MVEVFDHKLRASALGKRKDARAVGLLDVLLRRALHAVERKKGVGDGLHIVQRTGEQQIVGVHQPRDHLEIAHALTVVVKG